MMKFLLLPAVAIGLLCSVACSSTAPSPEQQKARKAKQRNAQTEKNKKLIFDPDKLNSHKKREKLGDISKPIEAPGSAFFWRDEPARRSERINSSPITY